MFCLIHSKFALFKTVLQGCWLVPVNERMSSTISARYQVVIFFKINGKGWLDLWHKSLGHPSSKIVKLVTNVNINKDNSLLNKTCDSCQWAKQTRDKFSHNHQKSSDVFELIHCDLWGAYRTSSSCGKSYFLTMVDDYSLGDFIDW